MRSIRIASSLLLFLTTSMGSFVYAAADNSSPVELSLGTIRTEAEKSAVGLLVKYAEKIDAEYLLSNADPKNINPTDGWLFDITPDVKIQTGDEDSFNGVIAKMTGNYICFKTTQVDGQLTPDSGQPFHVFPTSVGFEADRSFRNVSFLAEFGYVPFDLTSSCRLGLKTVVGSFVQAGYKFKASNQPNSVTGGATDESAEKPNSGIARLHLRATSNLTLIKYSGGQRSVNFIPDGRYWFDFVNSHSYYQVSGTLRFQLISDKSFDLLYERGSGAPNFNKGDQFSANLTIQF
jgi:hypothetical protein